MGWLNNAKNKAKLVINGAAAYAKSPKAKEAATKFLAATLTLAVVDGMAGYNPQDNSIQIGKHVMHGNAVTQTLYNGLNAAKEYSLESLDSTKELAISYLNTSKYNAERPIIRGDDSIKKDNIALGRRSNEPISHDKGMEMSYSHEPSVASLLFVVNEGMSMKDSTHKANMESYLRDALQDFSISRGLSINADSRQDANMSIKEALDGIRVTEHDSKVRHYGTVMNESSKADIFYCEPTSSYLVMTTVNAENGDVRRNLSEWSREEVEKNPDFAQTFMSESKVFQASGGHNGMELLSLAGSNGSSLDIISSRNMVDWHNADMIQKQYQKDGDKLNLLVNLDTSMKQGIVDDKNGIMVKVDKEDVYVVQKNKDDLKIEKMNDKEFSNWQAMLPDSSPIKAINTVYERMSMASLPYIGLFNGEKNIEASKMENGIVRVEEQSYSIHDVKGYSLESHASTVAYMPVKDFENKYKDMLNNPNPTHNSFRKVNNDYVYERRGEETKWHMPDLTPAENLKGNTGITM